MTMMIPAMREDGFSVVEWHRLDNIAEKHEPLLRRAFLMTVVQNQQTNSLIIRNVITMCLVETALSTADSYAMVFNPNAPVYKKLVDGLTDIYMNRVVNDATAKDQVRSILPAGLPLAERRDRLDTFGLDGRSAVRIERMRQEGSPDADIQAARISLATQRGNILALTEINRVINSTNEALWIENLQGIRKASTGDSTWFYEHNGKASVITDLSGIPKRARKEIVTRKDNRTCDYCLPLEGKKARLGTEFNTEYGYFMAPPFHPRCRCYMIVRA